MIRSFLMLVRGDLRDHFPGPASAIGGVLMIAISLTIYWYTARAFTPALAAGGSSAFSGAFSGDFFTYILFGETWLFVPLTLFEGPGRFTRAAAMDGTLSSFQMLPVAPQLPVTLASAAMLPRELIRMGITLAIAFLLYRPAIGFTGIASAFVFQILALPVFLGLGLLAAAFQIELRRGVNALSFVATVAAVSAGAYFPISVLPEPIRSLSFSLSPFTPFLEGSRHLLREGWGSSSVWSDMLRLLLWDAVVLPVGWLLLGASFARLRRKGDPLVFPA